MKAFKFACPVCGQHINADAEATGSQLECPTCFQKIVVPQAPTSEDGKFILSAAQVRKARPTGVPAEAGPALAAGSNKIPRFAIVAGGLLLCGVVTAFVFRDAIFKSAKPQPPQAQQETQTPEQSPQAQAVVNTPPAPIPAEPDARWNLDLAEAVLPDTSAEGRIHGVNFTCDRAYYQNGTLTLRQGKSGTADLSVNILLAKQEENWDKNSLIVTPATASAPKVTLRWKVDAQKTSSLSFSSGYAMKLEMESPAGGKVGGKIYISTPDEAKSVVVGTFTAEIRKPKPPAVKKPG